VAHPPPNYVNGKNSSGSYTANLRAVGMDGGRTTTPTWATSSRAGTSTRRPPSSQNGTPIYQLGNNAQGIGGNWDNGYALAHIFRDGNWDNVSNGVVWANGAKTLPPRST
jgi:hypothetical protein